jgi:hypothetical protein
VKGLVMVQVVPFSYRMKIRVEPNWDAIVKRILGPDASVGFSELMGKAEAVPAIWKNLQRTYDFTEFFESRSGLTVRFQRTNAREISYANFVDEFRDCNRLFGSGVIVPDDETNKFSVEVTERSIRNECFDQFIGGISPWIDGEKFFLIPIEAILEFVIALQLLLPETKTNSIIKWPDQIEQSLKKNDIKYEAPFSFKPNMVSIEQKAPEFFRTYGYPQVAAMEASPTPWFISECAYYALEIETFTEEIAGRNSRLSGSSFFGNRSRWFG